MVEVDVFWAYGIGAGCAAAAGAPLAKADKPLETTYFTRTLLLLSLVWAPTGLLLLLRHPSWETMQAAGSFAELPPWLVLAFGITNVTQGILGFWVTSRLLARGRRYLAHLNCMLGYFGMFFILLYGWDGHGYDRFLYDRDMFGGVAWHAGAGIAPGAGVHFLASSVAMTLYLDGVYLLPPMLYLVGAWQRADAARRGVSQSAGGAALVHLGLVFGPALGTAALSALAVGAMDRVLGGVGVMHVVSYLVGVPATLAVTWVALYAPGRPLHRRILRALALPVEEAGASGDLTVDAGALRPAK